MSATAWPPRQPRKTTTRCLTDPGPAAASIRIHHGRGPHDRSTAGDAGPTVQPQFGPRPGAQARLALAAPPGLVAADPAGPGRRRLVGPAGAAGRPTATPAEPGAGPAGDPARRGVCALAAGAHPHRPAHWRRPGCAGRHTAAVADGQPAGRPVTAFTATPRAGGRSAGDRRPAAADGAHCGWPLRHRRSAGAFCASTRGQARRCHPGPLCALQPGLAQRQAAAGRPASGQAAHAGRADADLAVFVQPAGRYRRAHRAPVGLHPQRHPH